MVGTDFLTIVLRLFHIVPGAIWLGAIFIMVVFLQPASKALGSQGSAFMAELLFKRKFVEWVLRIAGISVLFGAILYYQDWIHYPSSAGGALASSPSKWVVSRFGLAMTIGGFCALAGMIVGAEVTLPTVRKMRKLVENTESGEVSSTDIEAEMDGHRAKLRIAARVSFVLVLLASILMSSARYL